MTRKILGMELRDRLLSRERRSAGSEPTEEMRIEALSSHGNRDLLGIIATQKPQSISELATLAKRLQPNVSRSLSALARAGLLTATVEGRITIPRLTDEGVKKAQELGFAGQISGLTNRSANQTPALRAQEPVLSANILKMADNDSAQDKVEAEGTVRFRAADVGRPDVAHGRFDLNEICTNLLVNWWRNLCRRADPYKMFALQRNTEESVSQAILLAKSTGRIELFVRSAPDETHLWGFPRISLAADDFTALVLDELIRPLVRHLRSNKRFDRPVESLLHRTEEIMDNPADLVFWKSAGALGLSYRNLTSLAANNVTALIKAISDEGARLDFASTIDAQQLRQSLAWIEDEVTKKAKANSLPNLIELQQKNAVRVVAGVEPWRIGKDRAREARAQIGLKPDRAVGGVNGISRMFGGGDNFALSSAGEDALRGFQGFCHDIPVVVVRDEGPRHTAFLMSRGVGDYLVYGSRGAPIADIYSDRQAVGRAFAAEFMAPAETVVHMIDNEKLAVAAVANHYGVSRDVIYTSTKQRCTVRAIGRRTSAEMILRAAGAGGTCSRFSPDTV